MKSHCLKYKKYTENTDSQVSNTNNRKIIILSKWMMCKGKKYKLIKKQEAKGLLSKVGIRTLLSKIPLLCDILF